MNSETPPQSSKTSPAMTPEEYQQALEQMRKSAGNLGERSSVIPDSWRGRVKTGGKLIPHRS